MKLVKMKASFAGVVNMPAGSIQEMEDEEAIRMVRLGYAEYTEDESEDEPEAKKPSRRRRKQVIKGKESR